MSAEVAEVDQPVDVVDLAVFEPQRADQLLAQLRVHPGGDLEPHDLAEAAAAELVLDRLQQVVGLVGDREVGVAGDPEVAVVDRPRCRGRARRGWRRSPPPAARRSSPSSPTGRKRPSSSFGTLTRAMISVAALGVAQQHAEAEREVGDVGEGPAEADHQRRQRREDLLVEAGVDLAPLLLAGGARGRRCGSPRSSSAGRSTPPKQACRRRSSSSTRAWIASICSLGAQTVGAAGVDPGVELVEEAGDPDHEELVEVGGVDRRRSAAARAAAPRCPRPAREPAG